MITEDSQTAITTQASAIEAFLAAANAGRVGAGWFSAKFPGKCALTRAVIRPYMQIAPIGDGAFVRRDAVEAISIRGHESIDDVLARFSWASPTVAANWLNAGDCCLLLTASTLKPKFLAPKRRLGAYTLDEVKPLFWRSVAFMLRRK